MATIILIIHLMIAVALVALVLLQRSEGGALGIGGGGGLMTGRGAGNALTRATAILAALFFMTSLALGILATRGGSGSSLLDKVAPAPQQGPVAPVPAPLGSGLDEAKPQPASPAAPAEAPAVPRAQ